MLKIDHEPISFRSIVTSIALYTRPIILGMWNNHHSHNVDQQFHYHNGENS